MNSKRGADAISSRYLTVRCLSLSLIYGFHLYPMEDLDVPGFPSLYMIYTEEMSYYKPYGNVLFYCHVSLLYMLAVEIIYIYTFYIYIYIHSLNFCGSNLIFFFYNSFLMLLFFCRLLLISSPCSLFCYFGFNKIIGAMWLLYFSVSPQGCCVYSICPVSLKLLFCLRLFKKQLFPITGKIANTG